MSGPRDDVPGTATVAAPGHRSRWRRFSPSMGWRAFLSEIVIVVLGVVIALAANEAVDEWNWRNKVKEAEARLQYDITWAFLWEAEKYVSVPCVDAQLAALSRNVLESGDTLKPQPIVTSNRTVQAVVRLPNRPHRFPTWDALVADGTATHFTSQRQAFLSGVSNDQALSRESMAEMRRLRGRLMVMREPLPLDPAVRADLLTSINELRSIITVESLNAQQRMRRIADAGDAPIADVVELFLNASGKNPSGGNFSGMPQFCEAQGLPIGDWRDYQKLLGANFLYPDAGIAK